MKRCRDVHFESGSVLYWDWNARRHPTTVSLRTVYADSAFIALPGLVSAVGNTDALRPPSNLREARPRLRVYCPA